LAQRFDRLTFDHSDGTTTRSTADESGRFVMNGSGFVEMLAQQIPQSCEQSATPLGSSTPFFP
jgi:hypothetical protein